MLPAPVGNRLQATSEDDKWSTICSVDLLQEKPGEGRKFWPTTVIQDALVEGPFVGQIESIFALGENEN